MFTTIFTNRRTVLKFTASLVKIFVIRMATTIVIRAQFFLITKM